MAMADLVKKRATCPRRAVGAVIVKDKHVLTTGYNGAPKGFEHPCDTGCLRDELDIPSGMMADVCPCLHAEQNAIIQAATFGLSIKGAQMYCTTQPCMQCSRMIANSGITRVYFQQEYADPMSIGLLVTAGVELFFYDAEHKSVREYGNTNTFQEAQENVRQSWAKRVEAFQAGKVFENAKPLPLDAKAGNSSENASNYQDVEEYGVGEETVRVRDLSHDPNAEDMIKKLAQERIERERRRLDGEEFPE